SQRAHRAGGLPAGPRGLGAVLPGAWRPSRRPGRSVKACARETAESAFSRNGNRFTPRAVMCDTDPTVIDEVRHGAYRQLFAPDCLISHKEGAAGNYAVGRNAVGRAILPQVSQAVRRQAEACDRLEGLILYHSYGGGTGFRLHAACSWRACATATAGRRCCRWPCTLHQRTVEPYNTVACLQACEPLSSGVILLDNEAMYGIIQKYFGGSMTSSDYTRANRLCAQLISSLTAGFRFSGEQNATLADISTNLIPYPRLIYLSPSYAPMRRSGYVESSDKRAASQQLVRRDRHCRLRCAGVTGSLGLRRAGVTGSVELRHA
uniref:Tubulin domain-containing protein n=1 Tax=Macrostomum lignano TaxID=282301 RepID=A0A1I8FST6_9PLAT